MHGNNTVQAVLSDLKARIPLVRIAETRHVPYGTIKHWRKKFNVKSRVRQITLPVWKEVKQLVKGR